MQNRDRGSAIEQILGTDDIRLRLMRNRNVRGGIHDVFSLIDGRDGQESARLSKAASTHPETTPQEVQHALLPFGRSSRLQDGAWVCPHRTDDCIAWRSPFNFSAKAAWDGRPWVHRQYT